MIVYAESSAVLAWLFGERRGAVALRALQQAERVVASALTPLECVRALRREAARGAIAGPELRATQHLMEEAARGWVLLEPTGWVLTRAARSFPQEPVRTLDALHLASALEFHGELGDLTMLSLDDRVRGNAAALGLAVAP